MPKTTLQTLSFELLTCISNYLSPKDVYTLSQCNKALYQLQWMDSLWKYFCRIEFGIHYNHPNQSYRQLFISCCDILKRGGNHGRLPCSHLPSSHQVAVKKPVIYYQCQRCPKEGFENLFVCISPNCHQTICDRHARQHTRFSSHRHHHSLFYKVNTSELFCQICVDWIGGIDNDPAEQYIASEITNQWLNHTPKEDQSTLLKTKEIRRIERKLRWKDTPQYIMKNGFCFISSNWMAEWELFVEGWRTQPPHHLTIDQTQLLDSVIGLNRVGTNPFYLNSNGHVMIISSQTWNYLSSNYKVKGEKITEDNLKPKDHYTAIIKRIEYWKKRASDFAR